MNYPAVPKLRDEVSRLKMAFHYVILACPESLLIVIAACLQSFFEERFRTSRNDKPDCRQAGGNDNEKR
ncbi:MAG: hypothetical protein HY753_07045 [Nitrospirae bacterium]|nr:hypothetical protein [Nitrospirota bacterium]